MIFGSILVGTAEDCMHIIVRERWVSTANRFGVLQGEKKRDEVIYIYGGLDHE